MVAYGDAEFYRGPVGKNTAGSDFSLDGVTALPRVATGFPGYADAGDT